MYMQYKSKMYPSKLNQIQGITQVIQLQTQENLFERVRQNKIDNHQQSSNSSRFKKPLMSLIVISAFISSFGCGVHILYISNIYFNYSTTTSVTIATDIEPELPAVTFCMYLKNTFNYSKFYQRFGRNKSAEEEIPPGLSVLEINELGIDMDDVVVEFMTELFGHPKTPLKWGRTSKSMHVARDLKCVTLFSSNAEDHVGNFGEGPNHERKKLPRGTLLQFKLWYFHSEFVEHPAYQSLYRIYVHAPSANIGEVLYGTSFEIKEKHTVIVKVNVVNSVLLPSPYQTNCLNYSQERLDGGQVFDTRADCIEACLVAKSFNDSASAEGPKKWPRDVGIDLDNRAYDWSKISVADHSFPRNASILRECQVKECPWVDCVQSFIGLSLVLDKEENDDHTAILFVWLPTEPSYTFVHTPKMQLVEYVCYLGSVVSLWFGVSALTSFTRIRRLLTDYYERRKIRNSYLKNIC